jgi:iron complex outermembrane recepter protein
MVRVVALWLAAQAWCVRAQAQADAGAPVALGASLDASLLDAGAMEVAPPPVVQNVEPAASGEFGASARIQRAAGPGEYELGGTGSKTNAPLREVPATVNVIDQAQLRERGVQDLQQALSLLPGVVPMWTYGGFQDIRIRGFQAMTLYDGRRDGRSIIATSAPNTGLLDLDRIEVLRGPSAVLYGYGSVGGVVNQIRKRASRTPHYEIAGGLGTPYQWSAQASAQGPVLSKLAYRVDLGHVTRRDFRNAQTDRNQLTSTFRYTPTARDTFNLRLAIAVDRYSTDIGIPTIEDASRPGRWVLPRGARYDARYSSQQDHFDYRRQEASLDYRHDFSQQVYLEARASIVQDHYEYLAAETLNYVPAMGMTPAQVEREYLYFARGWRPIYAALELHADLQTGPLKHDLVAGYGLDSFTGISDRSKLDGAELQNVDFAYPVDASPKVSKSLFAKDHYRFAVHSLYAFDHLKLRDDLILTGGVRLDFLRSRTRREFLDRASGDETVDPETMMRRSPNLTRDFATTGSVGLVYTPWAPITAYVSYANAYKPLFVSPSARAVTDYTPERSQQFEGGVRLRLSDALQTLEVDAAGYLIRKKNLLVPRGVDEFAQAGLAESKGLDVQLKYRVPYLQLEGGYALIDAHYLKFVGPDPVSGNNVSFKGNQLQLAPRHSGTAWLRLLFSERVSAGLGARVMGHFWADDSNRLRMPSFALLDASVTVGNERASLTLRGSNLLNRVSYFSSVINEGSTNPQVTPGPGREIFGTLRMSL